MIPQEDYDDVVNTGNPPRWRQLWVAIALVLPILFQCTANAQSLDSRSLSGAQAIAIAGGGGSGNGSTGSQRITTVPNVIAPSFYGANPCSNSAAVGGAVMGFGISAGGQWTERECRDQEWFRFLYMSGQPRVAYAYACAISERVRSAFDTAGVSCTGPASTAAPVANAPSSIPTGRFEYCATASAAELRRLPECR